MDGGEGNEGGQGFGKVLEVLGKTPALTFASPRSRRYSTVLVCNFLLDSGSALADNCPHECCEIPVRSIRDRNLTPPYEIGRDDDPREEILDYPLPRPAADRQQRCPPRRYGADQTGRQP